jgi:hypothetical protein
MNHIMSYLIMLCHIVNLIILSSLSYSWYCFQNLFESCLFTCVFLRVSNLVCHQMGRTMLEGVWAWGNWQQSVEYRTVSSFVFVTAINILLTHSLPKSTIDDLIIHAWPLGTVRPIYRTGTPLPSKHPILCIFSTNTRTEFFKHAAHA